MAQLLLTNSKFMSLQGYNETYVLKRQFLDDIRISIKQWNEEGDNIIVFTDMNDDIWAT